MDMDVYLRFVLAFVLVIGLILLGAALLRRFSGGIAGLTPGRKSPRRLKVVETLAVDPRRRLVLVRRDDVEHLLLIGGSTDVVVESRTAPPPPEIAPAPPSVHPSVHPGASA